MTTFSLRKLHYASELRPQLLHMPPAAVRLSLTGYLVIAALACSIAVLPAAARGEGEKAQGLEAVYRGAFNYLTPGRPGEKLDGTPAIRILKGLPEQFPHSTEALLVAAGVNSYVNPCDYATAVSLYDRLLAIDPKNVGAHVGKGTALYRSIRIDVVQSNEDGKKFKGREAARALDEFDAALRLDPNNFAAIYNKASLLRLLQRSKEAIKYYERAAGMCPKADYHDKVIPELADEGKAPFVFAPGTECCVSGVLRYMVENDFSKTVGGSRVVGLSEDQIYISNTNDVLAFCYCDMALCWAQDDIRNYTKALECFGKAISLNPDVPQFYQYRAMVHVAYGHPDKASEDKARGQEILQKKVAGLLARIPDAPSHASASEWLNKSMALEEAGKTAEALEAVEKVLQVEPSNRLAAACKGTLLFELNRCEEAIAVFDKVLDVDPYNKNVLINKAAALDKLGRAEESLKVASKAAAAYPDSAMIWHSKGMALLKLGRLTEAQKCFQKERALDR